MMDIDPHVVAGETVTREDIRREVSNNGSITPKTVALRTHPKAYGVLFENGTDNLEDWEHHHIAVGATMILMKEDGELWSVIDTLTDMESGSEKKYMVPRDNGVIGKPHDP